MKNPLSILIVIAIFSCQAKTIQYKVFIDTTTVIQIKDSNKSKILDNFCDTTKIKDFKSNLIFLTNELAVNEIEFQLKQANEFIEKSCKRDTLFCGEISYKSSKSYKFNNEWKLLLTGYVFDEGVKMEENSSSFFVLTIMRNDEFWFTDILEDLIGEIQVELNGFEKKDKRIIVWGHAYPYFHTEYGKFKLSIRKGRSEYEFQCNSQE